MFDILQYTTNCCCFTAIKQCVSKETVVVLTEKWYSQHYYHIRPSAIRYKECRTSFQAWRRALGLITAPKPHGKSAKSTDKNRNLNMRSASVGNVSER